MAIVWCQKLFEGNATLRFGEQYIAVSSLISENMQTRIYMHMKQYRHNFTHDCINDYTTIWCISNRA